MLLHLLVQLHLQRAELALDDLLDLVRQLALHILLQPTQQERPKHFMQATNDEQRLFFVQLNLILSTRVGERRVKPLVEALRRVEHFRKDEVEQSPEFGKVVLERGTGENETVGRVVVLRERLRELALSVLQAMTFVCNRCVSVIPLD